ncbi:dual specificity protein phosphatase family protein [Cytobacillus firmus]|uniref:dual specificity protein phosphatase family protein n=1 Tax=Cytobacillus firmus TaxID=1399 RepID=UPI0034A43B90
MNFVEMVPKRLYIGGKISSSDWDFVQNNITAIVNLRTKPDQPPFDFSGRVMIWAPLNVRVAPTLEWVLRLMKQVNHLFEVNHRILIHDTIGKERLGFVITAFYMQRYRLKRDQALRKVRQLKSDIKPPADYMKLLLQYETYLGH